MHWAITRDPWPQQAPWGEMTRACSYSAGTRERSKTQGEDICKVSVYMHMLRCAHTDVWVPFMNPSLYECRTPPARSQTHREWLACYGATWWVGGGGLLNVDFNYKHLFLVTSQWTWREFSWIKTHTRICIFSKNATVT